MLFYVMLGQLFEPGDTSWYSGRSPVLNSQELWGFTEREIPRLHEVGFTSGTVALLIGCAAVIGAGVGMTALTRTAMTGLFDRLRASHSTPSRAWRGAQNGLVDGVESSPA